MRGGYRFFENVYYVRIRVDIDLCNMSSRVRLELLNRPLKEKILQYANELFIKDFFLDASTHLSMRVRLSVRHVEIE